MQQCHYDNKPYSKTVLFITLIFIVVPDGQFIT